MFKFLLLEVSFARICIDLLETFTVLLRMKLSITIINQFRNDGEIRTLIQTNLSQVMILSRESLKIFGIRINLLH